LTWEVRNSDCLDPSTGLPSLADRSVQHFIMDPPFSERVHRRLGNEGRSDGGKKRDDLAFGHLTDELAHAVAEQACRIATRWILIFCDELSFGVWVEAIQAAGGEYVRKGTWVKVAPMPQMSGDRPATGTEEIVIAHAPRKSGRMKWNGGGKPAVYRFNPQEAMEDRFHPTQKPLSLMEALVLDFSDHGDLIADPFAGSCATGAAALRHGRRFLGWEMNKTYVDAARVRLAGMREQLSLFGGGDGGPA